MNQVTELLRLVPGASLEDAVIRLTTLSDLMSNAKGFRDVEILRRLDDPSLIMVIHTWDGIEDWTNFRSSDVKLVFAASRPDFLYNFVPCGVNWHREAGEHTQAGTYVRRELVIGPQEPASGPDVLSSEVLAYQDYEPTLEGATLRITRLRYVPPETATLSDTVLADEVYESVKKRAALDAYAETLVPEQVRAAR